MKLYRFDRGVSHEIRQYGSTGLYMSRLVRSGDSLRVDVMHLEPDGIVGGHEAHEDQMFAVVGGNGWIREDGGEPLFIEAGQAAFWNRGEWHESGTSHGMTVIVIEGSGLNPDGTMAALSNNGDD